VRDGLTLDADHPRMNAVITGAPSAAIDIVNRAAGRGEIQIKISSVI
jgi:hypothetical protein